MTPRLSEELITFCLGFIKKDPPNRTEYVLNFGLIGANIGTFVN